MTTLPADPILLTGQVIANGYGHLGEVVQLPTGHGPIRVPNVVPSILWRANRDVPLLSASKTWARVGITVVTYHHDGHLTLDPADLKDPDSRSALIHRGYLALEYGHVLFRIRQRPAEPTLSRECGIYRAKHIWQASVRLRTN
ncbi:hypothetical protein [Micromonospora echinofusca]|uniref:hypothetical protein n=1 Tax=Micromonospora echinofusca TaxID=47858 RepID=UPI0033F64F95